MTERPLLISVVQYQSQLESGALTILGLVDKAHHFGVDGVELRREVWPAYKTEVPVVRARLEELGLLGTFATHSTLFNREDMAHQQMLEDIDTARALGSPLLRIFPGATPADDDAPGWAKARQAVDRAASQNITIALENFRESPGGTIAEVLHILERIDSPALKTNIDLGNYPLNNQDVPEAIQILGDRAVHVHIKDYSGSPTGPKVALGDGVLPLDEIFAMLNALPQRIVYCFEFGGGDDPDTRVENAIALVREKWL